VSWTIAERKNSDHFIDFLEHLLIECYPSQKVLLVLDRASFHRSGASLAALSLFEHRVRVIWLPSYCAELNPIERFWRQLKDLACANRLWSGLEELLEAVEKVLHQQNDLNNGSRFALSKYFQ
jgi:transposase